MYKLNYLTARVDKWKIKSAKYSERLREMKKALKSRDLTITNLRAKWHGSRDIHKQEINILNEKYFEIIQAGKKKVEQLEHQVSQLKQSDDAKKKQLAKLTAIEGEWLPPSDTSFAPVPASRLEVRCLTVLLFLRGLISYRSVPRVLDIVYNHTALPAGWCPDATSVTNWVLSLGLGLLNEVCPIDDPWIAIIDHSIGKGTQKVFVVLRIRLSVLSLLGKAPGLEDCECIGIVMGNKINGDIVAADLARIFEKSGNPMCVVKDRDATLNSGTIRWCGSQDKTVSIVDDIGHMVATCLKAEFKKDADYKQFCTLIGKGNAIMRQSTIAQYCAPRIREKARFGNLSLQAEWAQKILHKLQNEDISEEDSEAQKLHQALPGFVELAPFIERFLNTVKMGDRLMKELKNKGLTHNSGQKCYQLLRGLPNHSKTRKGLEKWLDKHIKLLNQIGELPLLVSSDPIESTFGKFKYISERSPQGDVNRSVLLIPTFCGKLCAEKIMRLLAKVRHIDLKEWVKENVLTTILQKKRANG